MASPLIHNPPVPDDATATLRQRFAASGLKTRYYNPEIHQAAFALPQYMLDLMA